MASNPLPDHQNLAAMSYLLRTITPIFLKNKIPYFAGSGWFLSSAGSLFLVTASHVAEEMGRGFAIINGLQGNPFEVGETRAYISPNTKRKDVAVFELIDKVKVDAIRSLWNVLKPCDLLRVTRPEGLFFVAGCPLHRMKLDEDKRLHGTFLNIRTCAYKGGESNGWTPEILRLSFDQHWMNVGKSQHAVGSVKGLSGSPVWKIVEVGEEELWAPERQLKVCGIQVAYKPDEYVEAHPIHLVGQAIRKINSTAGKEILALLRTEPKSPPQPRNEGNS